MARPRGRTVPGLGMASRKHTFIYWKAQIYRFVSYDADTSLLMHVINDDTEQREVLSVSELLGNGNDGVGPLYAETREELLTHLEDRQPETSAKSEVGLPANFLSRADAEIQTYEYVENILTDKKREALSKGIPFRRTESLSSILAQLEEPIGLTKFYDIRNRYLKYGGDKKQIAASYRRCTYNQTKRSAAENFFLDMIMARFYTRHNRPPISSVYDCARGFYQRTGGCWINPKKEGADTAQYLVDELLNPKIPFKQIAENSEKSSLLVPIKLPSRSEFYEYASWFKGLPDKGKAAFDTRYGKGAWDREFLTFNTFVTKATMPLQYVFVDHYLLDNFIVDEATRSQLTRLWLTVLIDAFSRSILGFALLYESPCIESVQVALMHSIWPKRSHKDVGLTLEWACFGIPQMLSLDNAWAHHSLSLENLSRSISQGGKYNSIELDFRPPYKARYGALIERLFGNLSAQIKSLFAGAIQSSNHVDIGNAAKYACWLYTDVYEFLQGIFLHYQHKEHSELRGMTPQQKFNEGMQQVNVQLIPQFSDRIERLFWREFHDTRKISSQGIGMFGMHYYLPSQSNARVIGVDGKKLEYAIHYDPSDISRIALFCDGDYVCDAFAKELQRADGTYRSVSYWECQMAKDLAVANGSDRGQWLEYLDVMDDRTKNRMAERKKAHRQQRQSVRGESSSANTRRVEFLDDEVDPGNFTDYLAGFAKKTR